MNIAETITNELRDMAIKEFLIRIEELETLSGKMEPKDVAERAWQIADMLIGNLFPDDDGTGNTGMPSTAEISTCVRTTVQAAKRERLGE